MNGNKYYKYPRTPHAPWSPGFSNDDIILVNLDDFKSQEVVVTIKFDGECTTMYHDHIHARSIDSKNHPSRTWVKSLHASIKYLIPEGFRICGENMYAKHSIYYDDLESYFLVFGIYNDENFCLSWDETIEYANLLGLKTVKQLYRGLFPNNWDDYNKFDETKNEGYVVRNVCQFHYNDFSKNCFKYVRANHVRTDEHWLQQEVIPNLIN